MNKVTLTRVLDKCSQAFGLPKETFLLSDDSALVMLGIKEDAPCLNLEVPAAAFQALAVDFPVKEVEFPVSEELMEHKEVIRPWGWQVAIRAAGWDVKGTVTDGIRHYTAREALLQKQARGATEDTRKILSYLDQA